MILTPCPYKFIREQAHITSEGSVHSTRAHARYQVVLQESKFDHTISKCSWKKARLVLCVTQADKD